MDNILKKQIQEIETCRTKNILQNFPSIDYNIINNNIMKAQETSKKMSLVLLKKLNRTKDEKEFNFFLKLYINTMSQLHKINNLK